MKGYFNGETQGASCVLLVAAIAAVLRISVLSRQSNSPQNADTFCGEFKKERMKKLLFALL